MAWLIVLMPALPAAAGEQFALVIGNGGYTSGALANPPNDATDVAAKLQTIGFQVDLLLDAEQREMEQAIHTFTRRLEGDGNVGLFYYAGHGVEYQGRNYLIPIGATIRGEGDLRYDTVDSGRVLDGMAEAGNGLNLVVLDACRNNPYRSAFRSPSRGLARMSPVRGTLILYATQPGAVARDGSGRNGVFTKHLLTAMDPPGLEVEQVFKQAALAVDRETGGAQTPWVEGVVLGRFYFRPPDDSPTTLPTTVATDPVSPPPAPIQVPLGHLQINVNTMAQVRLDGRIVGDAASGRPLNLSNLKVGEHRVGGSADGYVDEQRASRVEAGRWTQEVVTLLSEKVPEPVLLNSHTLTSERDYVVNDTRDGFVAVRARPTTKSAEVRRLRGGIRIACGKSLTGQSLSKGARWLHCPQVGGYIYATLLTPADKPVLGGLYTVRSTSDGFVAVRSRPSTSKGRRVAKLGYGQIVACDRSVKGERLGQGAQWQHCPDAGGWIYAPLLDPR